MPGALHQLRPIPAEFTGRAAEIDRLIANVRTHTSAITSINSVEGMPGIGKTELANFVGYALLQDYPDAQLFVELGANSPNPLTASQALARCLYAFYPDAKLPDDEASLRNTYLSTLQSKHALVILDDARDDAHIALLLPPASCAAIITSRRALRTGMPLSLDVLPRTESIKLLLSLCQRIDTDADTLAGLCGDLPIALTVAGGYLKSHISKPVDEYVKDLQGLDRVQRLRNNQVQLEALFEYSYRALTKSQQAAFKALSVMPADFDRSAALAVIGKGDAGANPLDELVTLNLLQYDTKIGRFRWHDLLREFAAGRADKQEIYAAAGRHSTHYANILDTCDDLFLKGNDSIPLGLALYDHESPNILVGQTWAAAHAAGDDAAAQLCIDYPDTGVDVLSLRLHPKERIRWLEASVSAARKSHKKANEGAALRNLGLAYADLGEARKAIEYHEQARVIDREIGDRCGEGADLGNLGIAYADLGDARKAIEFYEQHRMIAREMGCRRGEGNALGNLGAAYADLGDARKAIEFYEQALDIDREIGYRQGEGNTLGNLGNAYAALGDTHKAIEFYEQALDIDRENGYRQGEAIAGWDLGLAYEKQGDIARAVTLMQVYVDFLREIGHPDTEGRAEHIEELRAKLAGKGES